MKETGQERAQQVRLCDMIQARMEELLVRWEAAVRNLRPARDLSEPALRDHLPQLLDRIARMVRTTHQGGSASLEEFPDAHALARLDEGFDLSTVAAEFALLRKTILEMWQNEVADAVQVEQITRLNEAIDDAVAASVARFTAAQERTLIALDRISAAALGTGDLETFLPKLIQVLQETTEAVDAVVIVLRDSDDQLRVRAAVGLDLHGQGFSLKVGQSFAGKIAATREPCLLKVPTEKAQYVESEAIHRNKLRVLYGVPLLHEGEVLGVAEMGSRTAFDISDADKQLFRAMAQRATSLIAQSKLLAREREARAHAALEHERSMEAQHRAQAEEERAQRLETVLGVHPDFMYLLDRDHRFTYVSHSLLKLWRNAREDAVGRNFEELGYPQELVKKHRGELNRVLAGETVRGANDYTSAEGTRHYEYIFAPVFGDDGRVEAIAGTTRDVTERNQTEEKLQRAATFREQFIGILGHDLRNPLSAIKASADLLFRQDLKPGQAKAVRRIAGSVDRMAHMIEDVLDFTRGRLGGGIPVKRQRVNFHEVCRRVVDELHVSHPEREVVFEATGDGWGEWDPERVAQAVSNLVGNALQHGAADSPVIIRIHDHGEVVRLDVKNQGRPIPEKLLPIIFEPFKSSAVASELSGQKSLGLGLYIVHEIVRAHGGKVEVRSNETEGTTLSVWWPRSAQSAQN